MSDSTLNDLITLAQAAGELPRRRAGKKTHVSCLRRWATKGLRGTVLRTLCVGGVTCTKREWLTEFFEQVGQAKRGENASGVATRTPTARRRAHERAESELEALGI